MSTSWWAIEESLVSPHNIEHLVFAGVSLRQCKLRFGPIITHFISTWRTVTRKIEPNLRWHRHSPLFHNNIFLSGKNPFYCPQWIKCKVNSFGDIYDDKGLESFQDIKALLIYQAPPFSCIFVLGQVGRCFAHMEFPGMHNYILCEK